MRATVEKVDVFVWNKSLVKLDQYAHRKISKALWDKNIHNLQVKRNIFLQFFIFMGIKPSFYYFLITKTLNLGKVK